MSSGCVRQGGLERFRRALKARLDARRHAQFLPGLVDGAHRLSQGDAGREIERDGDHRELPLVIDGQRRRGRLETRQGAERHLSPAR